VLHRLLAVREAAAGLLILTTEEHAAHAARDAVVEARRFGVDQLAAGRDHGGSVALPLPAGCQPMARWLVGELLFHACPGLLCVPDCYVSRTAM